MRSSVALTGLLLATAACGSADPDGASPAVEGPLPNVLLVVYDDLGVDGPGCYAFGGDPAPTPTLDALAARGVRFTNAWSTPLCSPTRAAIQTGRYPWRTGIGDLLRDVGEGLAFAEREVTIPEMLARGTGGRYATAAIGKWHLGNEGADGGACANVNGYDHFSGGFLRKPGMYFDWRHNENGREDRRTGYLTTQTVDDAKRWIASAPEPWFCYLALHAPHVELHVPPVETGVELADDGTATNRQMFKAMLEVADRQVGELLQELGEARERTVVLVTGDNGTAEIADPPQVELRRGKGSVRQGGIHVPLVVAGPTVARPGTTSDALVHSLDLFATVAELAGVDLERAMGDVELDSVSLVPYLRDPDRPSARDVLYTEVFHPNGVDAPRGQYRCALRDARYKLIRTKNRGDALYDLVLDPLEETDLLAAAPDERPAEVRAAHERLNRAMERFGPGSTPGRIPGEPRNP